MTSSMKILTGILLLLLLFGCTDLGYYRQSIGGHLSVMAKRQPIEAILSDPEISNKLKAKLKLVQDVRTFAENELFMPIGQSFSTYVDIKRKYVVWNVVAAPAYSLARYEWCYPMAGCLPYRGYFEKAAAEKFAETLRQRGLDVYTYGVPAYSTLGWFDDPVLNTFINYPEWARAGLIFHEMAHQMVYAAGDGDFNEAFASMLEKEAVMRWLASKRSQKELKTFLQYEKRQARFFDLIASTREALLTCFDGRIEMTLADRRLCKEKTFRRMKEQYGDLKNSWGGDAGYDRWFAAGLNNARFITAHTYRYYIPAFEELLRRQNGDLNAFYKAVNEIADLPYSARRLTMIDLREASLAGIPGQAETPNKASGSHPAKSGI